MIKYTLVLIMCLLGSTAHAEIDMDRIAMIESSNNPKKYNRETDATGMYQVVPGGALADYNMAHIRNGYSAEDMYDPDKAYIVANWYYNVKIPKYLKAFGIEDTDENRCIAYHDGIGNLRKYLRGERNLGHDMQLYLKRYKEGK